jgi:hypothetical protein
MNWAISERKIIAYRLIIKIFSYKKTKKER